MLSTFVAFRIIVVFPHGCKELLVLSTYYQGGQFIGLQSASATQPTSYQALRKSQVCSRGFSMYKRLQIELPHQQVAAAPFSLISMPQMPAFSPHL